MRTWASIVALIGGVVWLSGCVALVPLFEDSPFQYGSDLDASSRKVASTRPTRIPAKRRISKAQLREQRINKHIANLKHPDAVVRIHAASYLGELGSSSSRVVDPLITSLDDSHYWVRRTAAKSLGRLRAGRAVPALKQSLSDRDRYVAHTAKNALKLIYASSYPTHN